MRHGLGFVAAVLAVAQCVSAGYMFEVDKATITECGPTNISWTSGAQTPLKLMVFANYSSAGEVDIPASAMNTDGSGTFSWALPYAADIDVVFIMSDASGWASGGASPMYKVQAAASGDTSCTKVTASPAWTFDQTPEDGQIAQCGSMNFSWEFDSGTVYPPVQFRAVIPGGDVTTFNSTGDDKNVSFQADVPAGSSVMFGAWDAQGRHGGVSELILISKGSTSCMNDNSLTSTTSSIWPSTTGSNAHSTGTGGHSTEKSSLNTGAIAGIAIGAAAGVILVVALLLWLCCRRNIREMKENHQAKRKGRNVDLYEGGGMRYTDSPEGHTLGSINRNDQAPHTPISPFIGGSHPHAFGGAQDFSQPPRQSTFGAGTSSSSGWDSSTYPASGSQVHLGPGSYGHSSFALSHNTGDTRSVSGSDAPTSYSGGSSSTTRQLLSTKAQMAAQNPDRLLEDPQQPRSTAPAGGFRRHEDAGALTRADPAEEPEVEDLPPTYNPDWEQNSEK